MIDHPKLGFLPYDDIEGVTLFSTGYVLRRRSGDEIRYVAFHLEATKSTHVDAKALTERIVEGMEAHHHADPPVIEALAHVERGGRSVPEWLSALRGLAKKERDYRSVTIPDEALWSLTEDPRADPTARAGAAIVLRHRLGEEPTRVRIEAAAAATAEPRVRVALDAAASTDDDHLLAAALGSAESELTRR